MCLGKLRTIRFEFTGSSIQVVFDKLPTAKLSIVAEQPTLWKLMYSTTREKDVAFELGATYKGYFVGRFC